MNITSLRVRWSWLLNEPAGMSHHSNSRNRLFRPCWGSPGLANDGTVLKNELRRRRCRRQWPQEAPSPAAASAATRGRQYNV